MASTKEKVSELNMKSSKVCYFDTQIWNDYLWEKFQGKSSIETKGIKIEELNKDKVEVVVNELVVYEISCFFKDWYILQKMVADGHPVRQFQNMKKRRDFQPTKEEYNEIDTLVYGNWKKLDFVNYIETSPKTIALKRLYELSAENDFLDFKDSLHLVLAEQMGCDYFVSNDTDILKISKKVPYKIVHPKTEFAKLGIY